eukprot:11976341-Heterocapsa_arctica.AAC.1
MGQKQMYTCTLWRDGIIRGIPGTLQVDTARESCKGRAPSSSTVESQAEHSIVLPLPTRECVSKMV